MKRILILTPRFPWPLLGGDKIRIWSIAQGLKDAGHELSLLSFVEHRGEAGRALEPEVASLFSSVQTVLLPRWKSYLNALFGIFSQRPLQTYYYRSREMASLVNRALASGNYDAVLVHLIRMAPYVVEKKNVEKVLEMTDALSLNYARSRREGSTGFLGRVYQLEEKRVKKYEKECVEAFDRTVVVSSVDREHLGKREKVEVIPHGVQDMFLERKSGECDPNLTVFIGNLRTHQNNDAVLFFVREIYSRVKIARPQAKLRIIGANPSKEVQALQGLGDIEVTGEVDDVREYVGEAGVSVCPVRIGAGVQGKVLESLAMGVPVVTTSVGAGGITEAAPGTHFLVADTPDDFAEAVLKIMENKKLRDSLVAAGKKLIEEKYLYSKLAREYAKLFS